MLNANDENRQEINDINIIKILLLGKTGVGKSICQFYFKI